MAASGFANTTVSLAWDANAETDIVGYKAYLGTSSGSYSVMVDVVGGNTTATFADLTAGTTYYFAVRAYNRTGMISGASTEFAFVAPSASPQLVVTTDAGDVLAPDSPQVTFESSCVENSNYVRSLTIHNQGTGDLTGLSVNIDGVAATEFAVQDSGAAILPAGGSTTVAVSFQPKELGTREAVLQIDAGIARLDVSLVGTGSTASGIFSEWSVNAGLEGALAEPNATPFGDGVCNLLKYAFNMNAAAADLRQLVKGEGKAGLPVFSLEKATGGSTFSVEFVRRKGSGLNYRPWVTVDMKNYSEMKGTVTVTSIDELWERVTVAKPCDPSVSPRMFGYVEVTLP